MNMCGYYLDAGMVGYTFRGMFGSYVSGDIYIKNRSEYTRHCGPEVFRRGPSCKFVWIGV